MLDLSPWTGGVSADDETFHNVLDAAKQQRERIVFKIQHDLIVLARDLGQTETQVRTKVEALFATFAAEWALYILVGASALKTAILADATLAWLDVDVAGSTIRTRIVNRLS